MKLCALSGTNLAILGKTNQLQATDGSRQNFSRPELCESSFREFSRVGRRLRAFRSFPTDLELRHGPHRAATRIRGRPFRLAKLSNRLTGSEYVEGAGSDEFHFLFGGRPYTGDTGGYELKDYQITHMPAPKASPGIDPGVTLTVNLQHPLFKSACINRRVRFHSAHAARHDSQGGYQVANRTKQVQPLADISVNRLRFKPEGSMRFTLYYWIGGGAFKEHQ